MTKQYRSYVCGPTPDPDDPLMEFDNYFGHVPKDFNPSSGRSRTHRQVKVDRPDLPLGYRYEWVPRSPEPSRTEGGES